MNPGPILIGLPGPELDDRMPSNCAIRQSGAWCFLPEILRAESSWKSWLLKSAPRVNPSC